MPTTVQVNEKTLQMLNKAKKEMKAKKIAVRTREGKDLGTMVLKKFVEKLKVEIERKK